MAGLSRRATGLNRGSFNRLEAAFYELLSERAVRDVVSPVLVETLAAVPDGLVLDVGCGGGDLTRDLRSDTHVVMGVDPSLPQLRRLRRRHAVPCVAAPADSLPFADATFAAVVSSCSMKHWPSLSDGLAECVRVLAPGGTLVVVEIDGGEDENELLRFAALTRVPPGLGRAYRFMARRSFVPLSPQPGDVGECLSAEGLQRVTHRRIKHLPFFVVAAQRAGAPAP